jgi:hypothetical protein
VTVGVALDGAAATADVAGGIARKMARGRTRAKARRRGFTRGTPIFLEGGMVDD